MEEACVCYGDTLLLRAEEYNGFLNSISFTAPGCFVQEVITEDIRFVPNHRTMFFQVVPKLSYENAKELKRLKVSNTTFLGAIQTNKTLVKSASPDKEEIDKFASLTQRVEAENEVNERTISQRMGEFVLYGQEIQLRQVCSFYFLKQRMSPADHDKSCTKVELSETGGSGVYFRVESKFKFKQDGDRVNYGDFLVLKNTKVGLYLHISDKPMEPMTDSAPPSNAAGRAFDFLPHPSSFSKVYETNLSSLKSIWRPQVYVKGPFNAKYLYCQDIIKLVHTEKMGMMVSEGVDYTRDGLSEVFILHKDEEDDFHSDSSRGMFILEPNSEGIKGGVFGYKTAGGAQTYRLRHFTSYRLACVVQNPEIATLSLAKHPHEMDSAAQEHVANTSLFSFLPTTNIKENAITNEVVVKIASADNMHYVSTSAEEWNSRQCRTDAIKPAQTDLESQFFVPIEIEEYSASRYKVMISVENVEEDAYQLVRPDLEEILDVDFTRSSQHFLYIYGNMLRDQEEPDPSRHARMQRVLTSLIFFCVKADSDNPFTCEGEPVRRRQQYLRELGIIDLVARILTFAFDSNVYSLDELTQSDQIIKVCTLCYRLMKHASTDYRTNEMYCAQWIGLYLSHVQRTQELNSFKAEETLTEILSDNKKLLEHFVTPKMIEKFVELVRTRQRDKKYMKLLTVLCTSQGEAITGNQNAISEIVLNNPENREAVLMPVRQSGGVIEVQVKEYERWVRLDNIQEMSDRKDSKRMYKYFVGMLEMVAELAYGRNHHTE